LNTQLSQIWWVFLLKGLAGIILGFFLITEPAATIVALTTLLGFYWLIQGVLSLVQVFVDRSIPWIWSLLSGIVGIVAGLFVLRHPLIAALTVPTVIVIVLGIQGLIIGVLEIISGFRGGGFGSFILGAINLLIGLLSFFWHFGFGNDGASSVGTSVLNRKRSPRPAIATGISYPISGGSGRANRIRRFKALHTNLIFGKAPPFLRHC
jgi:uncharacterized membrane protein HdeD (DUF308 family)